MAMYVLTPIQSRHLPETVIEDGQLYRAGIKLGPVLVQRATLLVGLPSQAGPLADPFGRVFEVAPGRWLAAAGGGGARVGLVLAVIAEAHAHGPTAFRVALTGMGPSQVPGMQEAVKVVYGARATIAHNLGRPS